jgi:phosphatidylserine/phosphatidylglycerophosphate/cardiolipin synthase-like enzyme
LKTPYEAANKFLEESRPMEEANQEEPVRSLEPLGCLLEDKVCNFYIGINAGGKLRSGIATAKKSIKIVSPYVTESEIERLREKHFGKLEDISIITSAEEKMTNYTHMEGLRKLIHREALKDSKEYEYNAVFKSVFFNGNFFHAKLYIIDDEIAYAGSMNFTKKGLETNYETCITLKDSEMVGKLSSYYDRLFAANLSKWKVSDLGKIIYPYPEGEQTALSNNFNV